jgi:hypothetical protein
LDRRRRIKAVCRGVLAFDRGAIDGRAQLFEAVVEFVYVEHVVRRGHAGIVTRQETAFSGLAGDVEVGTSAGALVTARLLRATSVTVA